MNDFPDLEAMRSHKDRVRKQALARRDALDPVDRIEMSLRAADHAAEALVFPPGATIAGFLPIRSEIDLRPLMDRLAQQGARLCLPAIIDRTTIIFRELVRGVDLVDVGFGTVGPGPEAEILDPDILLMPLAAFDGRGSRVGYGAGHYDRAVSRLHAKSRLPVLVGCAFSVQEVDTVPAEPHDVKMHAVVTENGFRSFVAEGKR